MRSVAIKINVSKDDQDAINKIMRDCGYGPQKRKFHCTFGFIEKMIPDEETEGFAQTMTRLLQNYIDPLLPIYEVEKATHLFGHVIAFQPTPQSLLKLQDINLWVYNKVKEISEDCWRLNEQTQPGKNTPHMTLWRARKPDGRLKKLEEIAETHPRFHLTQAGCVIF